jgi:hypothetical protein
MKTYEVNGYYGSGKTPCTVLVAENSDGSRWYVCKGSQNVNKTYAQIQHTVWVEKLRAVDIFTGKAINSLQELKQAINNH